MQKGRLADIRGDFWKSERDDLGFVSPGVVYLHLILSTENAISRSSNCLKMPLFGFRKIRGDGLLSSASSNNALPPLITTFEPLIGVVVVDMMGFIFCGVDRTA